MSAGFHNPIDDGKNNVELEALRLLTMALTVAELSDAVHKSGGSIAGFLNLPGAKAIDLLDILGRNNIHFFYREPT